MPRPTVPFRSRGWGPQRDLRWSGDGTSPADRAVDLHALAGAHPQQVHLELPRWWGQAGPLRPTVAGRLSGSLAGLSAGTHVVPPPGEARAPRADRMADVISLDVGVDPDMWERP